MSILLPRTWESETSKGFVVNSARLVITASHFFVLNLDVLFTIITCSTRNLSNCEHCSEFIKFTKHKLEVSKSSTCRCRHQNIIVNLSYEQATSHNF